MTKEFMDKINELLKAKGRQALSLDEADKVVGGGDGFEYFNSLQEIDDFCWIVEQLEKGISLDMAIEFALSQLPSNHVVDVMRKNGTAGLKYMLYSLYEQDQNNPGGALYFHP